MICEKCEHFGGRTWSEGNYICDYGDSCPYEEEGKIVENTDNNTITVAIDTEDISKRIESAFSNAVSSRVQDEIDRAAREVYDKQIKELVIETLQARVKEQVNLYMQEPITVGGGWNEPAEELPRSEYLSRTIRELLDKKYPQEKYADEIANAVKWAIAQWSDTMKRDINGRVHSLFNDITRQNLTDNFVAMLMNNESYKSLSKSVQNLLG